MIFFCGSLCWLVFGSSALQLQIHHSLHHFTASEPLTLSTLWPWTWAMAQIAHPTTNNNWSDSLIHKGTFKLHPRTNLVVAARWKTQKKCYLSDRILAEKKISNLQLNSLQPRLHPGIPLWSLHPFEMLSFNLQDSSPCSVYADCFGKQRRCVSHVSCLYVRIPEEARPAVSTFPWAKLLCRCPLKRGYKNKACLWSEDLLGCFSSSCRKDPYGAGAAASHPSHTDECIFHIRLH